MESLTQNCQIPPEGDMANYHLKLITPYLLRHAVEYERNQIEAMFGTPGSSPRDGKNSLSIVTQLLSEEFHFCSSESTKVDEGRVAAKRLLIGDENAMYEVFVNMIIRLLSSNVPLTSNPSETFHGTPETLAMDAAR